MEHYFISDDDFSLGVIISRYCSLTKQKLNNYVIYKNGKYDRTRIAKLIVGEHNKNAYAAVNMTWKSFLVLYIIEHIEK